VSATRPRLAALSDPDSVPVPVSVSASASVSVSVSVSDSDSVSASVSVSVSVSVPVPDPVHLTHRGETRPASGEQGARLVGAPWDRRAH
jgi:hypothetical protein